MQGSPEEYEKWLAKRKAVKFSNSRLFAGAFCVWALIFAAFVAFGWAEPQPVARLAFSCLCGALAVVWIKGQ